MEANDDGTVTISIEEYDELVADAKFLNCLYSAGVDNWDGFDMAKEMLDDQRTIGYT